MPTDPRPAPDFSPWLRPRAPEAPVSLAIGCMNFGRRTPEREARRIVDRALERGVRWFDTSDSYQDGASERLLGLALKGVPDAGVATKVGLRRVKGRNEGLAPDVLRRAIDESLERLGRTHVDLYYLHAPDRAVPIAETLDAMNEIVTSGRARAWGVSNFAAWEILDLLHRCDARGLPRPAVSQVLYNAAIRQIEVEYLRFAQTHRLHTTVYNALAGGLLAGTLRPDAPPPPGSRFDTAAHYRARYWTERLFHFAEGCVDIARTHDLTPPQLAYGWLASRPGVDSILLGPATLEHLDAALDACTRPVPEAALTALGALQRAFDGTDARYAR